MILSTTEDSNKINKEDTIKMAYKLLKDNKIAKQYNTDKHTFFYRKDTGFSYRQSHLTINGKDLLPTKPLSDDFDINDAMASNNVFESKGWSNPDPVWSSDGPELLDIEITDRCDKNCPYCYQAAKSKGQDMPLDLYKKILYQTHRTVTQVALGGGETTIHPEFCEILRITREDYGIVPNYTTNGDWLTDESVYGAELSERILKATREHCGAVAVSAHGKREEWEPKAILMAQYGIKTNIHFILSEDTIEEASELLRANDLHESINAIVFLLYKPVGRAQLKGVLRSRSKIRDFCEALKETNLKIGFDACSAPMIVSMTDINLVSFDSCEGGKFSGYVHVDGQVKACSFDKSEGPNINDKPFIDIWLKDLQEFRDKIFSCKCECEYRDSCYGGCPFAPEIVICDSAGRR